MQIYLFLAIYAFVFAPFVVPLVGNAITGVAKILSTQKTRMPALQRAASPRFAVAEA
jgi:hypothetical protein